jgi:hypothetical protein
MSHCKAGIWTSIEIGTTKLFNVHGSVRRNDILVYKSQQDAHVTEFIFCLRTALHVSGFTMLLKIGDNETRNL